MYMTPGMKYRWIRLCSVLVVTLLALFAALINMLPGFLSPWLICLFGFLGICALFVLLTFAVLTHIVADRRLAEQTRLCEQYRHGKFSSRSEADGRHTAGMGKPGE